MRGSVNGAQRRAATAVCCDTPRPPRRLHARHCPFSPRLRPAGAPAGRGGPPCRAPALPACALWRPAAGPSATPQRWLGAMVSAQPPPPPCALRRLHPATARPKRMRGMGVNECVECRSDDDPEPCSQCRAAWLSGPTASSLCRAARAESVPGGFPPPGGVPPSPCASPAPDPPPPPCLCERAARWAAGARRTPHAAEPSPRGPAGGELQRPPWLQRDYSVERWAPPGGWVLARSPVVWRWVPAGKKSGPPFPPPRSAAATATAAVTASDGCVPPDCGPRHPHQQGEG